jgi:hypothetical protein
VSASVAKRTRRTPSSCLANSAKIIASRKKCNRGSLNYSLGVVFFANTPTLLKKSRGAHLGPHARCSILRPTGWGWTLFSPFLFQPLRQVSGLEDRQFLKIVDDFLEISHWHFSRLLALDNNSIF